VALARLRAALRATEVAGTVTNLAFLGALADHAGFAAGDVDTGLIARDIEGLTAPAEVLPRHWVAAGRAAMGMQGGDCSTGFSLWAPLIQSVVLARSEPVTLTVETHGPDAQTWRVGDAVLEALRVGGRWSLDGVPEPSVAVAGGQVTVFDGYGIAFDLIDPLARAAAQTGDGNIVEAPMPGIVKDVFATEGQAVTMGDPLAVMEAMKMEHRLLAARDGVVAEVLVRSGDQVEAGAALVRLHPEEDAA
jgi:3-methylcrotonyl-CoA carboxylase alpha subunit